MLLILALEGRDVDPWGLLANYSILMVSLVLGDPVSKKQGVWLLRNST